MNNGIHVEVWVAVTANPSSHNELLLLKNCNILKSNLLLESIYFKFLLMLNPAPNHHVRQPH